MGSSHQNVKSTGFTERYAKWIAEEVNGDIITIKEAKNINVKNHSYLSIYKYT